MFNWRKNRETKRRELKYQTLIEFNALLNNCLFGSFEYILFEKAIQMLKDDKDATTVRKWVGRMERKWNQF